MSQTTRGIKAALVGLLVNIVLVIAKLLAGIAGHSYALVADAIESSTDIFSSLVVWGGLRITTRPADEEYPYGYGKAESLAAAVVSLMLLGAAMGIAVAAVGEIITPHHMPAPFTLIVIAVVVLVKEVLFRGVLRVGDETGTPPSRPMHGTIVATRSPQQQLSSASASPSGAARAGRRPTIGLPLWPLWSSR